MVSPARSLGSELVGTDDLAEVAGRELLPDAEVRPRGDRVQEVVAFNVRLGADPRRVAGVRVVPPAVDRLLDEPDRAVAEGDVDAPGVEARRVPRRVIAHDGAELLVSIRRVECLDLGAAARADLPPLVLGRWPSQAAGD